MGAGGSTTGGDPEPYPIRVHGASIGPGTAWSLELSAIVYGRLGMGGSGYPDREPSQLLRVGGTGSSAALHWLGGSGYPDRVQ